MILEKEWNGQPKTRLKAIMVEMVKYRANHKMVT
jgi:hypothetical protein